MLSHFSDLLLCYVRLELRGSKVVCNSVHPGCVRTEVSRNMNYFMRLGNALFSPILMTLQKTPLQGAYTTLHVATYPGLGNEGKVNPLRAENLNSSFEFQDITEGEEGAPLDVGQHIFVGGGLHYFHCEPTEISEAAKNNETAIRLWMRSEQLTGLAH